MKQIKVKGIHLKWFIRILLIWNIATMFTLMFYYTDEEHKWPGLSWPVWFHGMWMLIIVLCSAAALLGVVALLIWIWSKTLGPFFEWLFHD